MISLEKLIEDARDYIKNEDDIAFIEKGYFFAKSAHEGQFRKSGDPYIEHPLSVAIYLVSLQTSPTTIVAGLLHDVIEDCGVTWEEISKQFNEEVARLVEGVTKIGRLQDNKSLVDFQAENHRKLFIAMAKDIRVIIIKLADRLNNMRTLNYLPPEKQKKIAEETLDVYAPIAHRLGLSDIKTELEDTSLFYLDNEKYLQIENLLLTHKNERIILVERMKRKLEQLLLNIKIKAQVSGRQKSIYSIYKKIYHRGIRFEDIYDIYALRIICSDDTNCYEILGFVHNSFRPLPGRFKDYIAMPKPNMYQSLHTTVLEDGQFYEIQIRTKTMDEIASHGVAAHWRYKENKHYDSKTEQREIEEKLHWFKDFVTFSDEETSASDIEDKRKDVFDSNVYVLTPKGRVIDLPAGSTPIDFAYRIHTQVGHNCVGATINGILVPLNTILTTGDVVTVKTSKQDTMPSAGWLGFVRTNLAKNSIKKALNKKNLTDNKGALIEKGKTLFTTTLREKEIPLKEALEIIESTSFLKEINYPSYDDMCLAIGNDSSLLNSLIDKIRQKIKKPSFFNLFKKKNDDKRISSSQEVIIEGIDNLPISYASCCTPIPGDEIVGYISKGLGIKIHRRLCPNMEKQTKRLINVEWNFSALDSNKLYRVDLEIWATDREKLLVDLMNRFSMLDVDVNSINATSIKSSGNASISTSIKVPNYKKLQDVIDKLETVDGVYEIKRINKN